MFTRVFMILLLCKQGITGSNPVTSTIVFNNLRGFLSPAKILL